MPNSNTFKSLGYQLFTRLLDLPAFAFIIFGNHGLSDLGKGILGTFYWAFPLFILGKCPLHVLLKWLLEDRKTGSLTRYLNKVYGRKKFPLMVAFFLGILAVLIWLLIRAVSA